MYSASYGYPNAAAGGPNFTSAPPPQNAHAQAHAHLQPGPGPSQQQQQHQPPQHQQQQHQQMMYNAQQFPMGAQGAAFPGGPAMMGGGGPAGVMQNAAMPHMAANSQMAYQTPYTSSPYGPNIPSSAAPQSQMQPNYMIAAQMNQYPMNPGAMPAQQMMQRMHPSQQNAAVMSPQRPYNSQGTPTSMSTPQFPGPQGQGTPQSQAPSNPQQPTGSVTTPQTPTFPSGGQLGQMNGAAAASTPLSPGSESRERESFDLLLEINKELLYESIQLQNTRAELKKEAAVDGAGGKKAELDEQERLCASDYQQCMRRLQGNLAFLASLADRKSLPHPRPAVLTAPPLHLTIETKGAPVVTPDSTNGTSQAVDMNDRDERNRYLKELYRRLQACFPGVDPTKDYHAPVAGAKQHQAQPSQGAIKMQNSSTPGGPGSPAPGGHVQKTPQMANAAPPMMQGHLAGA